MGEKKEIEVSAEVNNLKPVNTKSDKELEIEKERLEIEKKRLEIETERYRRESRLGIFRKHFPAILTAMVSMMAFTFSGMQSFMSEERQRDELILKAKQTSLEEERQLEKEVISFIAAHQNEIFSNDTEEIKVVRNTLITAFPPYIVRPLFSKFELISSEPSKRIWKEGQTILSRLDRVNVQIFFVNENGETLANKIKIHLESSGYTVSKPSKSDGRRRGTVVYHSYRQEKVARSISNDIRNLSWDVWELNLVGPESRDYLGRSQGSSLNSIEITLPYIP